MRGLYVVITMITITLSVVFLSINDTRASSTQLTEYEMVYTIPGIIVRLDKHTGETCIIEVFHHGKDNTISPEKIGWMIPLCGRQTVYTQRFFDVKTDQP